MMGRHIADKLRVARRAAVVAAVAAVAAAAVSCGSPQTISVRQAMGRGKSVVAPALSHNDQMRLKYFYFEAMSQQAMGNYDAAFDLLGHCLTIDPNAAEVYFSISSYYAGLGRDSMAMQAMERAVVLNPENEVYIERLAVSYINTRNYDRAADAYERLYAASRSRTDVLGILAQLYNQQKK